METAPLGELCSKISSGGTPSRRRNDYFAATGGHLWVKSQELRDGPIYDTEEKISDLGLGNSSAKYYEANTVLVAMYGATVGKLAILRVPATVNQAICALCVDPALADYRYVYYALMATREDLKVQAAGAAQQNLNQGLIQRFEIPVLALRSQRAVSAVLGAFDDLIENNEQRINILDGMARLIYRKWFVHFRFPGHEDVELVNSDLGPIPDGWVVESLREVASIVMGQSPRSEFYNEEGIGLPFHQGVTNFGSRYPGHEKWCTQENRIAEAGDILLSVRAPVGRINVAPDRLVIGRGLSALRSLGGKQVFLFEQLRHVFLEEDSIGGGTIFKAVTKKDLQDVLLISPPIALIDSFEEVVIPMFELVRNLTFQIRVLQRARDLLLPRLISGELDISELDLGVEA